MTPEQRRFLFVDQCLGPTVFNFLLNGAIAWALFRGVALVPLWGQESIAGDTIATAFILPFLTSLIATRIVRRQIASGRVHPMTEPPQAGPLAMLASWSVVRRGAGLGLAAVVLAAVPTVCEALARS